jgi:replicative DNA helicase
MRRSARDAGARFMSSLADPGSTPEDLVRLLDSVRRVMADAAAARRPVDRLDELVVSAMGRVEDLYAGRESVGVPTGLGVLDAWCGGGLHRGDLTILGGRPSVGKSSLAQSIASHVARGGGRVYFASAEMGAEAVAIRALAAESGIDGRKFRGHPRMEERDWPAVGQAVGRIGRYGPNLLVDTRSRTMPAIAAQARRLHAQEPLTLIVVDHLQHLQTVGREENRTRAVGAMAAAAKEMAATLDVCVLVLSQLSRESPNAERKPRLSDLRDSGEIEQLADVVLLLHPDGTGDGRTKVRCLVAKHRNGELGELGLVHERSTGRWFDQAAASRAPEPTEPRPQQVAMHGA